MGIFDNSGDPSVLSQMGQYLTNNGWFDNGNGFGSTLTDDGNSIATNFNDSLNKGIQTLNSLYNPPIPTDPYQTGQQSLADWRKNGTGPTADVLAQLPIFGGTTKGISSDLHDWPITPGAGKGVSQLDPAQNPVQLQKGGQMVWGPEGNPQTIPTAALAKNFNGNVGGIPVAEEVYPYQGGVVHEYPNKFANMGATSNDPAGFALNLYNQKIALRDALLAKEVDPYIARSTANTLQQAGWDNGANIDTLYNDPRFNPHISILPVYNRVADAASVAKGKADAKAIMPTQTSADFLSQYTQPFTKSLPSYYSSPQNAAVQESLNSWAQQNGFVLPARQNTISQSMGGPAPTTKGFTYDDPLIGD